MEVQIVLPHPVEAVFGLLSEPSRRPEWQASLRRVELLTDGETRVGTQWYDVTTVPGVRPLMEITHYEPVSAWAEVGLFGGVLARLRLGFEGRSDRDGVPETLITATAEVEAPSWRRPVAWGMVLLGPTAMRNDLRRAGRVLSR